MKIYSRVLSSLFQIEIIIKLGSFIDILMANFISFQVELSELLYLLQFLSGGTFIEHGCKRADRVTRKKKKFSHVLSQFFRTEIIIKIKENIDDFMGNFISFHMKQSELLYLSQFLSNVRFIRVGCKKFVFRLTSTRSIALFFLFLSIFEDTGLKYIYSPKKRDLIYYDISNNNALVRG